MLLEAVFSFAVAFTPHHDRLGGSHLPGSYFSPWLVAWQQLAMPEAEFNALKVDVEKEARRLAEMELQPGQFASLHSRIDHALALWPKDAALHYLNAQVYGYEKDSKGAESELRRAMEIDPGHVPSYNSLAALYINSNQPERAIGVLRQLLECKPSAQTYSLMGTVEFNRKNYEAAAQSYRKALELDPNSDIAANNLAWLYSEAEWKVDLDEAVRLARGVVERNPKEPVFADTLGVAYYMKGLYTEALKHLSNAVSLARERGTDSEFFRFHLGMALAASGDKEAARRELIKALELGGESFKQAEQARKVLASLR